MKNSQPENASDRVSSVKGACVAVFFFYAFLLVFNGKGIHDGVRKLEFGKKRVFWLTVTEPVRVVSEVTRAAKLREGVESLATAWLDD